MLLLGELAQWIALLTSGWAVVVSLGAALRGREDLAASGRRAMVVTAVMLSIAMIALAIALARRDLSVSYVAEQTGLTTPLPFAIAALWTGPAGSVLVWAAASAMCAVLASRPSVAGGSTTHSAVTSAVLAGVTLLLVAALCAAMNPFVRLETVPLDGRGMNPVLQHAAVLVHPLLMLLAVAASTVPFALAVGALVGPTPRDDFSRARRWLIAAWVLLSCGMLSGMWWAYGELGWGGFWAWDPVQTASLAALLATSAGVHALALVERGGTTSRRVWTLAMLPFVLACITVFADRGVPLPSAHAFARSSHGEWFGGLLALAAAVSLTASLRPRSRGLLAPDAPTSGIGAMRRGTLVAVAGLLLAMTAATAWGLGFPLLASWVSGTSIGVGAPYFARVLWPAAPALGMGLVVAIVILSRDLVHNPGHSSRVRSLGGLLTHVGVLVLCAALLGTRGGTDHEVVVTPGGTFELTDPHGRSWRFVSQGTSMFRRTGQEVTAVSLEVVGGRTPHGILTSEERQYVNRAGEAIFHPTMEIGRLTTPLMDVRIVLVSLEAETATLRVGFVPFALWIWIGGVLAILGAALSWWPR